MPDDVRVLTLREGHGSAVALARVATSGTPEDVARWASWLRARSGREWLLLDDLARSWRVSGQAPVSGVRGWLGERLDEPTGLIVTVTSWHADGRFRQRATRALAGRRGTLPASALALRCLDHVPQVRTEALAGRASLRRRRRQQRSACWPQRGAGTSPLMRLPTTARYSSSWGILPRCWQNCATAMTRLCAAGRSCTRRA